MVYFDKYSWKRLSPELYFPSHYETTDEEKNLKDYSCWKILTLNEFVFRKSQLVEFPRKREAHKQGLQIRDRLRQFLPAIGGSISNLRIMHKKYIWGLGWHKYGKIVIFLFVLYLRNVINVEGPNHFVYFFILCLSNRAVFFVFVFLFYLVFLTLDQSKPNPGKEGLYFFCICVFELVYLFSPVFLTPGRLQPWQGGQIAPNAPK